MKKSLLTALPLALLIASPVYAQDGSSQSDLARLLSQTEARARDARQNFERLLSEYPDFLPELQRVAARLETPPEWLLNVMACESSFVASARNPLPGQTASGLLQIIEQTAVGLGTTTAAIRRMTPTEQLKLIEKYFLPFRGRLNNLADVYTAVFRGLVINGGSETVVAPLNTSPKERRAYRLNRGLDLNGDGQITKGELAMVAFGVGRFGSALPVAQPRVAAAGATDKQGGPSGSSSLYVASGATKPGAESSPVVSQTRSIYIR